VEGRYGIFSADTKRGNEVKELSYYPGCSLEGTAREYGESIRWTCCGASSAHCTDEQLAIELATRNLVLAEEGGRELLVPCVACYSRFKVAEKEVRERPERWETPYQGRVHIRYALDFFCEDSLVEAIKEKVVRPLSGLNVACYYGCLSVRPPGITGVKSYEDPDHMDRLMSVLGAEPLLLEMAKEAEADCLVTGCTMCQANLDTRQEEISKEFGQRYELPIFYFISRS